MQIDYNDEISKNLLCPSLSYVVLYTHTQCWSVARPTQYLHWFSEHLWNENACFNFHSIFFLYYLFKCFLFVLFFFLSPVLHDLSTTLSHDLNPPWVPRTSSSGPTNKQTTEAACCPTLAPPWRTHLTLRLGLITKKRWDTTREIPCPQIPIKRR